MRALKICIILLCFLMVALPGSAGTCVDLGRAGAVYKIAEPNFLNELRAGAPKINMKKFEEQQAHYQPRNLVHLPKAKENRNFEVNMSFTLQHAITDGKGHVIYPAGFKYNPVRFVGFVPGLVVIDGSDLKQVRWFEKTPYFSNKMAMLLISGGYAFELTRKLGRPVFYLTSTIAHRLKLTAVPSIVVRKGNNVEVTEVKIEK